MANIPFSQNAILKITNKCFNSKSVSLYSKFFLYFFTHLLNSNERQHLKNSSFILILAKVLGVA